MNGFGTSPLELLAADAMLRGEVYCEHFNYNAPFISGTPQALTAGGNATAQNSIDADSDFIVQMINASVRDNASAVVLSPNMSILITVAGSGRQVMDGAIPLGNFCGGFAAGLVPHQLTFPRLLGAKGTLTTQIFNREAFAPARVEVTYLGFKIFYTSVKTRQQIFHVL